jgi:hypothetical protein
MDAVKQILKPVSFGTMKGDYDALAFRLDIDASAIAQADLACDFLGNSYAQAISPSGKFGLHVPLHHIRWISWRIYLEYTRRRGGRSDANETHENIPDGL